MKYHSQNDKKRIVEPSSNILVTAVVTTYKRPELAKRAISSVLAQTYHPLEILVIEDGSITELERWCNEIEARKINYTNQQKNLGLAAARNTAIKMSRSNYIAFLDDDDEWKKERIERQMEIIINMPESQKDKFGVISCGVEMRFPEKNRSSIRGHGNVGNLREAIIKDGPITPSSTLLFSKDALNKVGGFDEKLSSSIDNDIWMSLAVNGYYAFAVDEPLVIIYDRSGRDTMMNDISNRIKGVKQYLAKWDDVHREWLGVRQSEKYNKQYFVRVISLVAADKFWNADYTSLRKAISEIFIYSNLYLFNISIIMRQIIFNGAQRYLSTPAIQALKKAKLYCKRLIPKNG